jgi:anhydro-N-acetylmuramic acid kinase
MKIAGIMTGTSCDGLDIACLKISQPSWKLLWARSAPYPSSLRQRVLNSQLPGAKLSLREFGELHRDIGLWIANSVSRILAKIPNRQRPEAIASHGQTVAHFPAARKMGFTLQLADPTRIAFATGLTVISNFRDGDMSAGGEGAPLAPRFHQLLARTISKKAIAIHNLGGISNLTYLAGDKVVAFDTGPGNAWIDAAAEHTTNGRQHFDKNGRMAAQGKPDAAAIEQILALDYFKKPPPKSTGRDDFPFSFLLKKTSARGENLVATATMITIESIAQAYERFLPQLPQVIYFCGGGAQNRFLLQAIAKRLPQIEIATLDSAGYSSRYLEAQAFAYFGHLALRGRALGGSWTGAAGWAPPAHIIPGENWQKIVQKLSREVS